MNEQRLIAHFQFEESCNLHVHLVEKKRHIGWGRCLDTKGLSDEELEYLGVEDEDDLVEITQEQADYLFNHDIKDAIDDAIAVCAEYWNDLSSLRQEMLVSAAYNLGRQGLKGFRKMHKALIAKDYGEAAVQMMDSHAAKVQAPNRYKRMAAVMRTDSENWLELSEKFDIAEEEVKDPDDTEKVLSALKEAAKLIEKAISKL